MIKNNIYIYIYIDDHLPVILEEYEKMSYKELEQNEILYNISEWL